VIVGYTKPKPDVVHLVQYVVMEAGEQRLFQNSRRRDRRNKFEHETRRTAPLRARERDQHDEGRLMRRMAVIVVTMIIVSVIVMCTVIMAMRRMRAIVVMLRGALAEERHEHIA